MKAKVIIFGIIYWWTGCMVLPGKGYASDLPTAENIYRKISALSCDSLIKANVNNPGFVILDVRTPGVWVADHLQGSINRNYYDADFSAQLNALPKHKIFLMHCQSGGRSGPTLTLMKNLNFSEVYEMSGGINAWKAIGLPTTAVLAPRLMLVSVDGQPNGSVQYNSRDTMQVIITNRANDTLKFTSVTLPGGGEFTSDFDLNKKLTGAEDYSFSVFYDPLQLLKDSAHVVIRSNGGDISFTILVHMVSLQQVVLNSGWNIFSVNLDPVIPDMKSALKPLIDDGSLIKVQDEEGNSLEDFGVFGGWTNNIGEIKATEGYKIKVSRNCQLTIAGTPVRLPLPVPLNHGWNIIGYPLDTEYDGKLAVQQLINSGTLVKVQDESGNTIEDYGIFGGWVNNIGNFKPGEGYKIKVAGNDILIMTSDPD